jgi:hypothetical protein
LRLVRASEHTEDGIEKWMTWSRISSGRPCKVKTLDWIELLAPSSATEDNGVQLDGSNEDTLFKAMADG